jgi:DNA-binding NarL/FixJ family response regulator
MKKQKPKKWAKGEDKLLLKLSKKGLSHKEIGEELGRSVWSLEGRLARIRGRK